MADDTDIIADSSALISFAAVDRLDLLGARFERIGVSPGVIAELSARVGRWPAMKQIVSLRAPFFPIQLSSEESRLAEQWQVEELGRGEAESIAAGHERNRLVLIDDQAAREFAENRGIRIMGTLAVLRKCKERGLISEVKPIVAQMCATGRFFRTRLVEEFLRSIGEH